MHTTRALAPIAAFLFALFISIQDSHAGAANTALNIDTLRAAHPRLMLTSGREAALRERAKDDPFLKTMIAHLRLGADWALAEPPVSYQKVGPRLLAQSRACLGKVATLSFAYRWFGDERYARRALTEMRAAAAFPDWNPSHFLDTAELCAAFAIGYDWLHDWLAPEERAFLRRVMIEKGLQPGRAAHARQAAKVNNWNPVCNGGMVLAALAIAEDEPAIAREFLGLMENSIMKALSLYAPDGAWYEGPGYWKYGTTYLVMLLDSLETALGGDGGLSAARGLDRTGDFFMRSIGTSGAMFNYADSGAEPGSSPALFWLARRHGKNALAVFEKHLLSEHFSKLDAAANKANASHPGKLDRQELMLGNLPNADLVYSNRFYALEIVWYPPANLPDATSEKTRSALFRGATDTTFLSGRDSGVYVGLKGAGMPNNHAHLDAGSFVLDTPGTRWVADLGVDDYDLPDYFDMREGGKRWEYFRLGSLSHNVITINGQNQRTPCRAPITGFSEDENESLATVDLSDAYRQQAARVSRSISVSADGLVRVRDEIVASQDGDTARWAVMTDAKIKVSGNKARLLKNGKTMRARIVSPANAVWENESARPATAFEKQNEGFAMLACRVPMKAGASTEIIVEFSPAPENAK